MVGGSLGGYYGHLASIVPGPTISLKDEGGL
jgi:hypothetical protein